MKNLIILASLILCVILLFACGESQQFVAIPKDLNRDAVPKDTIEVIAKDYEFIPDTIRVKQGTLVTLKLKSIEGTHGFELGLIYLEKLKHEPNIQDSTINPFLIS